MTHWKGTLALLIPVILSVIIYYKWTNRKHEQTISAQPVIEISHSRSQTYTPHLPPTRTDFGKPNNGNEKNIKEYLPLSDRQNDIWQALSQRCKSKLFSHIQYFSENEDELRYQEEQWRLARGYRQFKTDPMLSGAPYVATDYDTYDLSTLLELADQGDVMAAQMAAEQYQAQHPNLEHESEMQYVIELYTRAAALGSTKALFDLSGIYYGKSVAARRDKTQPETVGKYQILTAAWREVGKMRNDILQYNLGLYESDLTDDQRQQVQDMAQAQYQDLSDIRDKEGLPPFDNTLSKVSEYFLYLNDLKSECDIAGIFTNK